MEVIQAVAIAGSLAFLGLILDLVRRRTLAAEYSLIWLVCGVALLVLSIWRSVLHALAAWLGIFYPPTLLLLVLVGFVCVGALLFTVALSRHRAKLDRLTEEVALLNARLREDRDPSRADKR